jgi:polysaccharide deacetylase 2 family uncharacterized protein YibQ
MPRLSCHDRVSLWLQPWGFWLPSIAIAVTCVLLFSVFLASTIVGRQAMNTLCFALGWQHITQQQQQLIHAVEATLQAAGLPAKIRHHGFAIPQRRGHEYWQRQTHTIQVPPEVSLGLAETLLRDTTRRLHHVILERQKQQRTTHETITLTVGIAGVPTDIFVFTQSRDSIPLSSAYAKVAIVIDDLGWDLETAQDLLTLDVPLSFAILPSAPYRAVIAQEAQRRGWDILLHLPMEPYRYPDMDPGQPVLLSTMSMRELAAQIGVALNALPLAVGVNNHMGSRLTENRAAMQAVMQQMKHHHLFFLDSRTTQHSVAYQVAQEMDVPTAQRQVFLDHEVQDIKIQQQLRHLATLAHAYGSAIGIGHPYPETLRVLQKILPTLRQDDIEIVPVSHLVR